MRRVAVNRIVKIPENVVLSHQVIEIGEDGFCISCAHLEEEISETEWFAGIIVLSPSVVSHENGENFLHMIERLCLASAMDESIRGYRAFLVNPFDIAKMSFVEDSCISLLK